MFIQNKYTTWYHNIINNAKARLAEEYSESHHIIPRSLGGSNTKDNLVKLLPQEHYICHLLLTKMLTGEEKAKMIYALKLMSTTKNKHQEHRYIPSSRIYAIQRKMFSEVHSARMKLNHPFNNPENRKKHQAAIDKRGSTAKKGSKRTEQTKEKLRNKTWTQKALDNRLKNCLESAKKRKGKSNPSHSEWMFNNYVLQNEIIIEKIWMLFEQGLNKRQISLKLEISWDRVNAAIINKQKISQILLLTYV
jgi:hypothetical protein